MKRAIVPTGLSARLLDVTVDVRLSMVDDVVVTFEHTRQSMAGDVVLSVDQQPEGGKPLLKWKRRVLKDGSDLERELGGA